MPAAIVIGDPAKVAAVIASDDESVVEPFTAVGNPEAVTITEVPAGPVVGESETVGAVMLKVTGGATSPAESVICTVC